TTDNTVCLENTPTATQRGRRRVTGRACGRLEICGEGSMFRYIFSSILFLGFACAGLAQDDEPLFSRISDKTLEKIFDDGKIEWERKETTDKKGKKSVLYWITYPTGLKATVANSGTLLSVMSLGFKTKDEQEVSLERINEWNLRHGFGGAGSVNKNGFANVGSAHNMYAGTNKKIISN